MGKNYSYENAESSRRTNSSSTGDKLTYLLIGGGVGALVALLFAPKAGQELRGDIADVTRKGYDKTLETAQQLKEQSGTYYQQIKDQASDAYEVAADKIKNVSQQVTGNADITDKSLGEFKDDANKAIDSAKQAVTEAAENQKTQQHSA